MSSPGGWREGQATVFAGLLGQEVMDMTLLAGGRNSRVLALDCRDGSRYVGKVYVSDAADPRDRLGTEFEALSFLRECGERAVPRPLAMSRQHGSAVYEFISGRASGSWVDEAAIDRAVSFLGRLGDYGRRQDAASLGKASEACFSGREIFENIDFRLRRLLEQARCPEVGEALRSFLVEEFSPFLDRLPARCRQKLAKLGRGFEEILPAGERVLSPSDFGFHNCLFSQEPGREIVFVDFEYFGWDDPAKMIADFLLHPAMSLSRELKSRFWQGILAQFGHWPQLGARVEALYPLFGLKWCLILLNECVPADRRRRGFAAGRKPIRSCPEQLDRARRMLARVKEEFNH